MNGTRPFTTVPQAHSDWTGAGDKRAGVVRLTLTDFRSYGYLRLDVDLRPVVICGPNGAGKTNLLEALSFLAPGRGLRAARLTDVGRKPSGAAAEPSVPWGVAASLATGNGAIDVGTGLSVEPGRAATRIVRIEARPAKGAGALAQYLGVVWLTPAMDRLFLDGPSSRRKFIDRLVTTADADHAGRMAAYDHAYRQRLRLLRDGTTDAAWYAALEDTMARHGVAIACARADLITRLNVELTASTMAPSAFPAASLALVGAVDAWLAEMPAVDAEDALRRSLWDERRGIAGAGAGPHRSDVGVAMVVPGHPSDGQPAAVCSTGEQKALLIAILFAHARLQRAKRGHAPVLLLDEVAAHLDRNRRTALFDEILKLEAQAWLTGTDLAVFQELAAKAQFFIAEKADISTLSLPQ